MSLFGWTRSSHQQKLYRRMAREYTTATVTAAGDTREKVVILGSGWGGYVLSRKLDTKKFKPIVVSPRSYFVFTPFLNDSATGSLDINATVEPVRKAGLDVDFIQAWAEDVDFGTKTLKLEASILDPGVTSALQTLDKQEVLTEDEKRKKPLIELKYDKLIISVGCYAQTFGTPGVKENALFLKDVGDAQRVRRRVLELFEMAGLPTTPEKVQRYLLHFAIVGGGPTGTEFAATLSDLIREDMKRLYPHLMQYVRITLYDVAPKVLNMFDESLVDYAMKTFKREGVDVKTSHHIESLRKGQPDKPEQVDSKQGPGGVYTLRLKEEGDVGVGLVVWSTGNMANPFIQNALAGSRSLPTESVHKSASLPSGAQWSVKKHEKTGSLQVNEHLQLQLENADDKSDNKLTAAMRDVFAIGDAAVPNTGPLPATAQVATQEAKWLAQHLNRGDVDSKEFAFNNLGIMTYLGSSQGLVEGPGSSWSVVKAIKGRLAYYVWKGAYLVMTLSWKNKLLVPFHWMLVKMFGRDVSRY